MAKNTTTVFERAERIAAGGSAAECARTLAELEALERDVRPAWDSSRPTTYSLAHDGRGHSYQVPSDPGARYRAAALANDAAAIAELEAEHGRLTVQLDEIARLRHRLTARRKTAAEEERRRAAPGRTRELVREIDGLADRLEAAATEYREARAALDGAVSELRQQRELAGDDGVALSLETFFRVGTLLAHRLDRPREWT